MAPTVLTLCPHICFLSSSKCGPTVEANSEGMYRKCLLILPNTTVDEMISSVGEQQVADPGDRYKRISGHNRLLDMETINDKG